ncbi:MAG TPA: phosphatidate cytidylyltransferase [Acidimicrobiales bacterium]|nr:phosphatidate cytidylyltransferase [Acidimicrobiales bacterium]
MDDRDEYEPEAEVPIEPVTERVRIIGAQTAGAVGGPSLDDPPGPSEAPRPDPAEPSPPVRDEGPSAPTFDLFGDEPETLTVGDEPDSSPHPGDGGQSAPSGRNGGDPLQPDVDVLRAPEPTTVVPDMPHWTDPPTGQVPAILDRRTDEDDTEAQWSAVGDTGPAWREHSHEWDDSSFDPSLLADDETRVGALEETPLEERRPWEFDNLTTASAEEDRWEAEHDVGTTPTVAATWSEEDDETEGPEVAEGHVVTASPGSDVTAPPDAADRGVASISSSPLRAPRDPSGMSPPSAPRGPVIGRSVLAPGSSGDRTGRNMPVAIATGVAFALVAVLCFELGTVATLALATVVVALSAAECYAALRRAGRGPATLLGLVATVAVMVAAYAKGLPALPLVLVLVVITSMVWYLVASERGSTVEGVASTLLGFMWVGFLGSFAALLLAPGEFPHRHGIAFLLGAIVATIGADVGALAIGSWLGRHHLAPTVSPNKTWEGLIGGAVVSIALSAAITGQVHPWTVPKAALLGLIVAVVAPIGDLCESLVKRDLGLKDMGSILPGHGGVLDRVDALLFVLPTTFYLVRVLNLG